MPRRLFRREPGWFVPILVLLMLVLLVLWLLQPRDAPRPAGPATAPPSAAEGYLFCHWNVENFYDDRDDPHNHDDDEDWFGRNPEVVREKVERLASALLLQNGGRGPDILAMVEVESLRAVELLRDALNDRLPAEWHYHGLLRRDYRLERRLSPAILTRLPVRDDLTHLFPKRRILEAHIEVDGAPLIVLTSHWTSRLREGTEQKREAYADVLYEDFLEHARSDPKVDLLISGDFNDEPDDPSVRDDLHAVGDPNRVLAGGDPPLLLDLMAGKDPARFGTYYQNGRWEILDHLVASPGLLDPSGWLVRPDTLAVQHDPDLRFGRNRRPWRFGGPKSQNPRGYSDHFAVTVRLRVSP
jgi:endonuclease/exonuclease/phosphatase family metal-dependent hydrolase